MVKPFICLITSLFLYSCADLKKRNRGNFTSFTSTSKDHQKMFFTITINNHILQATLSNTEAANELIKLLPLTIKMNDLNDNEKYGNLPLEIPTSDYYPNIISEGDIMLYGTKTLVIFYKTFPTTYQYTLLGKINKPSQLKKIMGSGPVTIKLSHPMSEK